MKSLAELKAIKEKNKMGVMLREEQDGIRVVVGMRSEEHTSELQSQR